MVFHQCNPALFLKWNDWLNRITLLLNLTQLHRLNYWFQWWIYKCKGTTNSHKNGNNKMSQNLRIFCPLLGTVHYWGLLLNKNGWEAGFCPLLGAFPLLGSALLGEYSVFFFFHKRKNKHPTPLQKGDACLELPCTFTCERLYFMLHEFNDGFSNIKKRCMHKQLSRSISMVGYRKKWNFTGEPKN